MLARIPRMTLIITFFLDHAGIQNKKSKVGCIVCSAISRQYPRLLQISRMAAQAAR
jgi:hypothetical protein